MTLPALFPLPWSQAPLQTLTLPSGTIHIQRDDLLHPVISGNKWRKLTGWLDHARQHRMHTLLTYGGAYSNHLVATACLARHCGLHSIGIIRGEEPMENLHLTAARGYGMTLWPVTREMYRDKARALDHVRSLFHPYSKSVDWPGVLVIPQGGSGLEAYGGFATLLAGWQDQGFTPQAILHASATGTTATGLALAVAQARLTSKILAVPVLHNLPEQQAPGILHGVSDGIQWLTGFETGGYAKTTPALRKFCQDFTSRHHIPCEPIYTGKALHALTHLIETGALNPQGLVFLHTGGVLDLS